jgi:hypothetical protein
MSDIEDFKKLQESYRENIDDLNNYLSKKFFFYKIKPLDINIKSYDDMYDILYLKNKFNYLDLNNMNKQIQYSDNIEFDIYNLLKTINYTYFDDMNFKKITKFNKLNRFNPKEKEILFYNCLKRDIFNQNKFKSDIFLFEDKLKDFNKYYNKICEITFYEDEDLKMIWFIITIEL